ncbi:MAG: hypothetical protein QXR88_01665 [Candidatus Pacearchaeota archaeon]
MNATNKEFKKIKNFDFIFVSFPTQTNLTNFILAMIIQRIKPKLLKRFLFKDLPFTMIVNKNLLSPSIDIYYKKIKNKKYLFVIGNYKPRETNFYNKIYNILKKGKEIIFLEESIRKEGLFYFRKEFRKTNFDINKIRERFIEINDGIIKGFPYFLFEKAKKDKLNLTFLFFNANEDFIFYCFDVINNLLGNKKLNIKLEKSDKKNINKFKISYVG